jgi:hypothetical protein
VEAAIGLDTLLIWRGMDEVFIALLSAVGELLLEVFFQVVVEAIVALVVRSVRNVLEESNAINPFLAGVGYFVLGIAFGIASLRVYPHLLFHPSKLHGISLVISPVITGFVMSQVGTVLRRKGKQAVRIESFGYGFTLALGLAIIRFIYVK